MRASFSQGALRSRIFDLNIASEILTSTKPHNSEYFRFSLYLSSAANIFYAAKVSSPVIMSTDYTIGFK